MEVTLLRIRDINENVWPFSLVKGYKPPTLTDFTAHMIGNKIWAKKDPTDKIRNKQRVDPVN